MLMTLLAPGLVSKKPSSISGVTKILVILVAHEVTNVLLLHIGIEIIDSPLANALNTALFLFQREKIRSHVIFLRFRPILHGHWPGALPAGATGTNAPARLSGAPRGLLARLWGASAVNFLAFVRDFLQLSSLAVLEAPIKTVFCT